MNIPSFCDDPSRFEDFSLAKYVRFSNDRVLFVLISIFGPKHRNIVESALELNPELTAVSAGTIKIRFKQREDDAPLHFSREWFISDGGSTSAKLPRAQDDEKAIEKELGEGFVYNFDLFYE